MVGNVLEPRWQRLMRRPASATLGVRVIPARPRSATVAEGHEPRNTLDAASTSERSTTTPKKKPLNIQIIETFTLASLKRQMIIII